MEDRLMQGTGNGEAWTTTDSFGFSTWDVRPSIDMPAGARLCFPICMTERLRWDTDWDDLD